MITDDTEYSSNEVEQTTTITFGIGNEGFQKKLAVLTALSESDINVKQNTPGSLNKNRNNDEEMKKKAVSSIRPPRKSFSQSSPSKQICGNNFLNSNTHLYINFLCVFFRY